MELDVRYKRGWFGRRRVVVHTEPHAALRHILRGIMMSIANYSSSDYSDTIKDLGDGKRIIDELYVSYETMPSDTRMRLTDCMLLLREKGVLLVSLDAKPILDVWTTLEFEPTLDPEAQKRIFRSALDEMHREAGFTTKELAWACGQMTEEMWNFKLDYSSINPHEPTPLNIYVDPSLPEGWTAQSTREAITEALDADIVRPLRDNLATLRDEIANFVFKIHDPRVIRALDIQPNGTKLTLEFLLHLGDTTFHWAGDVVYRDNCVSVEIVMRKEENAAFCSTVSPNTGMDAYASSRFISEVIKNTWSRDTFEKRDYGMASLHAWTITFATA